MKSVDRWFILIALLYGAFGFAFGGINERFEQAHLHAHINLIGFASMVMFGLLYRTFPALATSKLAAVHFILYNLGAPLAQAHQTVALAAGGSLTVLSAWSHSSPIIPERIQRARGGNEGQSPSHIRSAPRAMAARPVRETSTNPSGCIRTMNCSIFESLPVISKMKCSVEASMTEARKASARRSASTRFSPLPATLTSASSRSTGLPRSVRSVTECTGTSLSS